LQDEDFTRAAVFAPLDIHRPAVVLFDDERLLGEGDEILLIQAKALPIGHGDIDRAHAFFRARRAVDHLDGLRPEVATKNRTSSGAQCRLVEIELVGVHCALDDRFT